MWKQKVTGSIYTIFFPHLSWHAVSDCIGTRSWRMVRTSVLLSHPCIFWTSHICPQKLLISNSISFLVVALYSYGNATGRVSVWAYGVYSFWMALMTLRPGLTVDPSFSNQWRWALSGCRDISSSSNTSPMFLNASACLMLLRFSKNWNADPTCSLTVPDSMIL